MMFAQRVEENVFGDYHLVLVGGGGTTARPGGIELDLALGIFGKPGEDLLIEVGHPAGGILESVPVRIFAHGF